VLELDRPELDPPPARATRRRYQSKTFALVYARAPSGLPTTTRCGCSSATPTPGDAQRGARHATPITIYGSPRGSRGLLRRITRASTAPRATRRTPLFPRAGRRLDARRPHPKTRQPAGVQPGPLAEGATAGHAGILLVAVDRGFQAECDQCSTRCAPIAAADAHGALSILRAAGWSFNSAELTYCPKCGQRRQARVASAGRQPQARGSPPTPNDLADEDRAHRVTAVEEERLRELGIAWRSFPRLPRRAKRCPFTATLSVMLSWTRGSTAVVKATRRRARSTTERYASVAVVAARSSV
jgi:hypothetical protein